MVVLTAATDRVSMDSPGGDATVEPSRTSQQRRQVICGRKQTELQSCILLQSSVRRLKRTACSFIHDVSPEKKCTQKNTSYIILNAQFRAALSKIHPLSVFMHCSNVTSYTIVDPISPAHSSTFDQISVNVFSRWI